MKRTAKRLASLALVLVLLAALSCGVMAADSTANAKVTGVFCYSYARQQLDMINSFRTGSDAWYWNSDNSTKTTYSSGALGTLKLDAKLEQIAMERARELAVVFSHTRPNGTSCFSLSVGGVQSWAENIAAGYSSPSSVFSAWREDNDSYSGQGHRRNMLGSGYTAVGFGCFYHQGTYYWVQEFGYDYSGAPSTASDSEVTGYVQYSTDWLGENYWSDAGNCRSSEYNPPSGPSVTSLKADKTTAQTGTTITWTATASGGSGTLQYCFYVYKDGVFVGQSSYSTSRSFSFTPNEAGTYVAQVYVKDGNGSTDELVSGSTTVTASSVTITGFTVNKTTAKPGDTLTWTVTASGGTGTIQYSFNVYKDGSAVYQGSYGSARTCSYTPATPGTYTARVYVKDGTGTVTDALSTNTVVSSGDVAITALTANRSTAKPGDSITWTVTASGGSGSLQYCFYVCKDNVVVEQGSFSPSRTYAYTPSATGSYTAWVFVKDGNGATANLTGGEVTVSTSPLSISSLTASKSTAKPKDSITWTASASGGTGTLQYCFYIYKDGSVVQQGSYGTARTYTYAPSSAGTYTARVYVKDGSGTTTDLSGAKVTVSASSISITGLSANKSTTTPGNSITWTASASGGSGTLQYCFYIYKDGSAVLKGSYGTAKSVTYTASSAGVYTARVYVKDSSGATADLSGGKVTVSGGAVTISSLTANKSTAKPGDSITWTASASGGTGSLQYCCYIFKDVTVVQRGTYSTTRTVTFKATAAGAYTARVYVKDSSGSEVNLTGAKVTVSSTPVSITGLSANKTSAKPGDSITWTASASGGSGTLQYCFYIFKDGTVVQRGTYGTARTATFTATSAGAYTARVYVKDGSGATVDRTGAQVTVSAAPITISSVSSGKSSAGLGSSITWTATASGGSGTLQYCFYIYKDGTVVQRGTYGTAKFVTYTATATGTYTARVYVKDSVGTTANLTSAGTTVGSRPITISSLTANAATTQPGSAITWTATASGGSGTLQYCFYIYKDGSVIQRGSYGTSRTVSFVASTAGVYSARVYVKDSSGTAVNLAGGQVSVVSSPLAIGSLTANAASAQPGATLTWTAAASGGTGSLQYCFYVFKDGTVVQRGSYGTARTYSYKATAAGVYTARVYVKDSSDTSVSLNGGKVSVVSTPLTIGSITANTASAAPGATITWTASASGGAGTLQYCFYVFKDGSVVQRGSYGTARTYSYKATAAGVYTARVYVKDTAGTTAERMSGSTIVASAITVSSVKANVSSTMRGNAVTWTATASGGVGTLQYCFYVFKDGKVVQRGSYGTARTFTYTPTAAGQYTVRVYVKDTVGTEATKDNAAAVTVS